MNIDFRGIVPIKRKIAFPTSNGLGYYEQEVPFNGSETEVHIFHYANEPNLEEEFVFVEEGLNLVIRILSISQIISGNVDNDRLISYRCIANEI